MDAMDDEQQRPPRANISDPGCREQLMWMCCAKRDMWPPPDGVGSHKASPIASLVTAPKQLTAVRTKTPPKGKRGITDEELNADEKPMAGFRLKDTPWAKIASSKEAAYQNAKSSAHQPKPKVVFAYASQTGKGAEIARALHAEAKERGLDANLMSVGELGFFNINAKDTPLLVLVASTTGIGEPPDSAATFFHNLTSTKSPGLLKGVRFALLGLGSRNYTSYQKVPRAIKIRMLALGAKQLCQAGEADAAADAATERGAIDKWSESLWGPLEAALKELRAAHDTAVAAAKKPRHSSAFGVGAFGAVDTVQNGGGKGGAGGRSGSPAARGSLRGQGLGGSDRIMAFEDGDVAAAATAAAAAAAAAATAITAGINGSADAEDDLCASSLAGIASNSDIGSFNSSGSGRLIRTRTVEELAADTDAALVAAGKLIKTASQRLAEEVDAVAKELGFGEDVDTDIVPVARLEPIAEGLGIRENGGTNKVSIASLDHVAKDLGLGEDVGTNKLPVASLDHVAKDGSAGGGDVAAGSFGRGSNGSGSRGGGGGGGGGGSDSGGSRVGGRGSTGSPVAESVHHWDDASAAGAVGALIDALQQQSVEGVATAAAARAAAMHVKAAGVHAWDVEVSQHVGGADERSRSGRMVLPDATGTAVAPAGADTGVDARASGASFGAGAWPAAAPSEGLQAVLPSGAASAAEGSALAAVAALGGGPLDKGARDGMQDATPARAAPPAGAAHDGEGPPKPGSASGAHLGGSSSSSGVCRGRGHAHRCAQHPQCTQGAEVFGLISMSAEQCDLQAGVSPAGRMSYECSLDGRPWSDSATTSALQRCCVSEARRMFSYQCANTGPVLTCR
uniref:Flavodoxin-like domain-containing protein n=1 Tax=Chlamydomonas euryale TaxID=1486919 RepID=A0A7R9V635_9CHLO|mmetsp:Transcript_20670/g.61688  ORF Transcript_20670/g.61688 Transcript_20670/m.61688 type:complete len:851 (+) Transcript_20670:370-2922(+)